MNIKLKYIVHDFDYVPVNSPIMTLYCSIDGKVDIKDNYIKKTIWFPTFEAELSINGMKQGSIFYVWFYEQSKESKILILAEYLNNKEGRVLDYNQNNN